MPCFLLCSCIETARRCHAHSPAYRDARALSALTHHQSGSLRTRWGNSLPAVHKSCSLYELQHPLGNHTLTGKAATARTSLGIGFSPARWTRSWVSCTSGMLFQLPLRLTGPESRWFAPGFWMFPWAAIAWLDFRAYSCHIRLSMCRSSDLWLGYQSLELPKLPENIWFRENLE